MKIDAGNFADCLGRIADRGKISASEALDLLQQVSDRAEKMRETGEPDPLVAAASQLVNQVKTEAKERAIEAERNARKNQKNFVYVSQDGIGGAADRARSLLYWQPGAKNRENVQTLWHAKSSQWGGLLFGKLRAAGLTDAAKSPEMQERIAQELLNARTGTASSAEATDPARRIAQIWAPIAENMRGALNGEGARIAQANDYIAHMSHDPVLMRAGGRIGARTVGIDEAFNRWWQAILSKLDETRTFADVLPREGEDDATARLRFGRAAFNAMVTGIRKNGAGADREASTFVSAAFDGTHNIARKLSEGRLFFFKDAPSWSDYLKQYGRQTNMLELMNDAVNSESRQYAMMRVLGTNPSGNFATITRRIQEHFRDLDPDGVVKFDNDLKGGLTQPNLDNVMALLDGSANIPANQLYYKIGSTVRQFYDTVYLGAVGVTHLSAAPMTFSSEARFHGVNIFSALAKVISSLVPERLRDPERVAMLSDAGAYADGVSRELFDPYSHGVSAPGVISDIHSRFMTATGLPYLISHFKAGMRELAMNVLSRNAGQEFETLEPHLKNRLASYGLGKDEWNLVRSVEQLALPNGKSYLTPKNAMAADPAAVEALLRARGEISVEAPSAVIASKVQDFQQELGDRLMMYLTDAAEHSVVTPGVRERALWTGGVALGSPQREILASAMQYKTWPLAAVHQILGREVYEGLSKKDAMGGLGAVIALSVLGGYMRMTVRDLAYGDQPRVPQNLADGVRIGLAALAQGGGLGIFGDMLFGQVNRFGASNTSTFGGPAATDLSELYGIFNRWGNSIGTTSKHDFWPDLARWGLNHIPFGNLVYLKGALDYMLMYHVYEAMSPGWWQRTNQRMLKDEGRTMQGYRPGGSIPYAPFGIGVQ